MELSSQDAAFGRNQSAEKRARGRRLWCAGAGQGSEEPRAPPSAPCPQTQTPTYSSTEGCHGNLTIGQARGAPSSAAGSPPVNSPPHPRTSKAKAWAASPAPGMPAVPPLDLRSKWGSGANTEAGMRQVGNPHDLGVEDTWGPVLLA